jgi:hypothetical protein
VTPKKHLYLSEEPQHFPVDLVGVCGASIQDAHPAFSWDELLVGGPCHLGPVRNLCWEWCAQLHVQQEADVFSGNKPTGVKVRAL